VGLLLLAFLACSSRPAAPGPDARQDRAGPTETRLAGPEAGDAGSPESLRDGQRGSEARRYETAWEAVGLDLADQTPRAPSDLTEPDLHDGALPEELPLEAGSKESTEEMAQEDSLPAGDVVPDDGVSADGALPDQFVDAVAPPPSPELVARYDFEFPDEPLVQDTSLYGHHGTPSPGVVRGVTGKYGMGVRFDGALSTISMGQTPELDITGPITIEAWVYLDTPVGYNRMLVRKTLQYQLSISVIPEPNLVEFYSQPLGFIRSDAPVDFGRWVYLAVTHDGAKATFYVDGILESVKDFPGVLPSKSTSLHLGGDGLNQTSPDGGMDGVRIWNVLRTPQEICEDGGGAFAAGPPPECIL